jgi:hypothetical protein
VTAPASRCITWLGVSRAYEEGRPVSIVEVKELRKQYDPPKGVLAVDGVSFDIA